MSFFDFKASIYEECENDEEKITLFADYLLKNVKLMVNDSEYSLEEIEFYYYSKDHKDSYTHKDNDQLINSGWYFHKYKNGTYKSGTYKGLDMTFGNGKDYGGILIRSIMCLEDNKMVIGPCNVVNHILEKTGNNSPGDLVESMKDLKIFNNKNIFYLKKEMNYDKDCVVFSGPRVGLSLKYPDYLVKGYRFLKQPDKIPKYKNTIVSSLHNKGIKIDKICKMTKIKKSFVEKSIQEFNEGKEMDEDEIKEIGVNKINVLYGYYCNN